MTEIIDHKKYFRDYELFCLKYHEKNYNEKYWDWRHIPEYVLINSGFITDYNSIRLLRKKSFEDNINYIREYGIDGISVDINNNYHIIQCKYYSENNIIKASDLGTFYQVYFLRILPKNLNSKAYLYYSSKLQIDTCDDFKNTNNIIPIRLSFDPNQTIINNENNTYIQLRDYQIKAIEKLKENWNGKKILSLPCGTGKTLVCIDYVKQNKFKNVFIVSPFKVIAKQSFELFKKYIKNIYNNFILVYSDNDGILDKNYIDENINKNNIFSFTFNSFEIIFKDLKNENKINYDETILIIDEAHGIINREKIKEIIMQFKKVLFVTATPPVILEEELEADIIYNYKFKDAIKDGYICDYEIYLPEIDFEKNKIKIKYNLPEEDNIFINTLNDIEFYKKGFFILNGMLRNGHKNCIIYLSTHDECENMKIILEKILNEYHYLKNIIYIINSETKYNDRNKIFEKFNEKTEEDIIKIICSVKVLDEGIDIISCDSVFITNLNESSNEIRIIQRMCRAIRKDPNNFNKKAGCYIWSVELNNLISSLQFLKENDILIFKNKIKFLNNQYKKSINLKILKNIEVKEKIKNDIILKIIKTKCLTHDEKWLINYDNLIKYIIDNKNLPNDNLLNFYNYNNIRFKKNLIKNKIFLEKWEKIILIIKDINKEQNKNKYFFMCYRCNYKTLCQTDIKRHIDRKYVCDIKNNDYNLNINDWKIKSLEKIVLNDNEIIKNIIEKKNNENESIKCESCEKTFFSRSNKYRHLKICKEKKNNELEENNNNTKDKDIDNNNEQPKTLMTNNIQNNNIQNNIFFINILEETVNEESIKNMILPFYSKFNTSHLSDLEQLNILINNSYVNALNELLKNNVNLNYFISDDDESMIVYKNMNEKFVTEKKIVIYENIWNKITFTFLDILEKIKNQTPYQHPEIYQIWKNKIIEKHNNFINKTNDKDYMSFINGVNLVNECNKERFCDQYRAVNNRLIRYEQKLKTLKK